jgi:hypothetical protein
MRSSGVASEGRLIVAVLLVTFALLVLFAGGPQQFMVEIEQGMQGILTALSQFVSQKP